MMHRIVQEALNNAAKHGGARRAQVEVVEDEAIRLGPTVRATTDAASIPSARRRPTDWACSGRGSGSSCCTEPSRPPSSPGKGNARINATFPAGYRRGVERRGIEPRPAGAEPVTRPRT